MVPKAPHRITLAAITNSSNISKWFFTIQIIVDFQLTLPTRLDPGRQDNIIRRRRNIVRIINRRGRGIMNKEWCLPVKVHGESLCSDSGLFEVWETGFVSFLCGNKHQDHHPWCCGQQGRFVSQKFEYLSCFETGASFENNSLPVLKFKKLHKCCCLRTCLTVCSSENCIDILFKVLPK